MGDKKNMHVISLFFLIVREKNIYLNFFIDRNNKWIQSEIFLNNSNYIIKLINNDILTYFIFFKNNKN